MTLTIPQSKGRFVPEGRGVPIAIGTLALLLCLVDVATTHRINVAILYPALLALAMFHPCRRFPFLLAILTTVLTAVGYVFPNPLSVDLGIGLFNPCIAIATIWIVAAMLHWMKAAQADVQRSEKHYRELADGIPHLVFVSSAAGATLFHNRQYEAFTGLPSEKIAGYAWKDLIHPDDMAAVLAVWKKGARDGHAMFLEYRLRRADGEYRWHICRAVPSFNPKGDLTHWIGTASDIHELKIAAERIRQNEERLRLALLAGNMGAWTYDLSSMRVVWTQEQEKLFGLAPGSFQNRPLEDILALIHPEDRDGVRKKFEDAIAGGYLYEADYRVADTALGETRWMSSRANVEYGPNGLPSRVVGVTCDISDRKRTEQKLQEKTRHLQSQQCWLEAILNFAPTPMLLIEREQGRIVFANKAADEMAGGEFPKDVPVEDYEQHYVLTEPSGRHVPAQEMPAARVIRGERLQGVEVNWHTPLGTLPLLIFGDSLPSAPGQKDLCILTFNDISKIKKQEEELRFHIREQKRAAEVLVEKAEELSRSNAELARFAYVASHDLKEPLRMVSTYSQMIGRRYKDKLGKDGDTYIGYVTDGVKRMYSLIEDLLAYSRIGTAPDHPVDIRCEDAYEEALENLKFAIEESHAVVTHDPLPKVIADRTQLVQLFQNLIGNALKYRSERRPEIHVRATESDDSWIFSVKDNGIGIEADYHDRIFVLFQRLHTKEQYSGTGIGLAICKKIVERQGGKIWVESEVDKGSTFSFSLPAKGMKEGRPVYAH